MFIFIKLERNTVCYVNVCQLKKLPILSKLARRTVCFENVCQLKISTSPKHADCGTAAMESGYLCPKRLVFHIFTPRIGGVGLDFTIIYRFPDITGYDRPASLLDSKSFPE